MAIETARRKAGLMRTARSFVRRHLVPVLAMALLGFVGIASSVRSAFDEPMADLTIDADVLAKSYDVVSRTFTDADCAVQEHLVSGPGTFTLLRFSVTTPNIGTADLVIGDPTDPDNPFAQYFHFSQCHGHYHFDGYAEYELLSPDGASTLVSGRKQAFCLEDYGRYLKSASKTPFYDCDFQGISVGWQDTYSKYLAGQWLDVTGVPPGNYFLRVTINPDLILPESDPISNNSATVPVTIGKIKK